jgi:hypothetical protein
MARHSQNVDKQMLKIPKMLKITFLGLIKLDFGDIALFNQAK